MNIIFLGTPEFALPALDAINNSRHKILIVISQPDREKDKKGGFKFTPVKKRALALGLKVYQFEKVSADGIETVEKLKPDAIVTAAYGQLLSERFLSIPKHGVFNIHGSLLPKYRGAAPIHAAILNGDECSGVTIMKTVYKMDAGDMLKSASVPITEKTTFIELHDALSVLGAELIVETLNEIEEGKAVFTPQSEDKATYTKKITKEDGHINFAAPAAEIIRRINAFYPAPSAYAYYNGDNLKIHSAEIIADNSGKKTGEVIVADKDKLIIKCGTDALGITFIQAPGKTRLAVQDFLRGYKIQAGGKFE